MTAEILANDPPDDRFDAALRDDAAAAQLAADLAATEGGSVIDRFDDAVDRFFDTFRGTEPTDRIMYALTELGDFGLLWVLLGWTNALRGPRQTRAALRLTAALAAESVLINGIVKNLFKRERPVVQQERPHRLRIPLTTSFPSGHSSTAMLAGMLLTQRASRPTKIAVFTVGGLVAASRVHVRIHHASDVLGGLVVGLGLGAIARVVWPLQPKGTR